MAKRDHHRRLDAEQPWRAWYKTARWQKLRWSVLVRDRFTCVKCKAIVTDTSRLVCDHTVPHRGREAAFWGGPFQTLCKDCHDGLKQSADRLGYEKGSDEQGRPVDPAHPWNRA